jgi:hypothetical protein
MDIKHKGTTLVAGIYLVSDQIWPHEGDAITPREYEGSQSHLEEPHQVIQRMLNDRGVIPHDLTLPLRCQQPWVEPWPSVAIILGQEFAASKTGLPNTRRGHFTTKESEVAAAPAGMSCETSCRLTPAHTDISQYCIHIILYMPSVIDEP